MKIKLLLTGKTKDKFILEGFADYIKRINHYVSIETLIIPDIRNTANMDVHSIIEKEAESQLKCIEVNDYLVLLDEKGKDFSSVEFSAFLQQRMSSGIKNLCFLIGGPYGFSERIYNRANQKIALSKMTFSHQLVRIIFAEQLYRAFTILKNEPYHHA